MADPRCLAAPPRPPRGPQRFERGRVTRAQMSIGVRLLLGALAVAGGEDSTHHRSASFWNDLDDGSSVPKGAESTSFGAAQALLWNYSLELPSLQYRGGGRAAAARVRQPLPLVAGAPRDAVRAQRLLRRLLLMAAALEQASAHPAPPPHTLATWSTLGASARSGSSSSPPSTSASCTARRLDGRPGARALRGRRAPRTRSTTSWCRARRALGCSRGAAPRVPTRSRPRASRRTTSASR